MGMKPSPEARRSGRSDSERWVRSIERRVRKATESQKGWWGKVKASLGGSVEERKESRAAAEMRWVCRRRWPVEESPRVKLNASQLRKYWRVESSEGL
jgi:hypothetical protein